MKKILLIATGGTIASKDTGSGLEPKITPDEILHYIPEVEKFCQVSAMQVCNIDSTNMNPATWSMIVKAIRSQYDQYDGFVIAHGTDTMAYSAAALSYMIQNSRKPIVLTGSQKSIDLAITDGKTNLLDAFHYAADDKSQGVQIVFNGKVISGTRAKKVRSKSFNAFDSIDYPFLAVIQGEEIIRYIQPVKFEQEVTFYENMNDKVCLMKLIPGVQGFGLEETFDYYDAIIVESFGVGGIPSSISDKFYRLHQKHPETLIVMATQVAHEGSDMTIYEVGQKIKKECNFLESYDMTLEAVIAKVMWMVGNFDIRNVSQAEDIFYKPINYDLVFGKNRKVH